MLCGQQLVKSVFKGWTSGFRGLFGKISIEDSLYLWTLGNAIPNVICYLLILHNFCTTCGYDINLLIRIVCFVLRCLRFNDAIVRSLVQEVNRLNCL